MRKLRVVYLHGDKRQEKENDKIVPIHWKAFAAEEMFMYFFPKDIEFDGANDFHIHFEKKPEKEQQYKYDDYFHISTYYVDEKTLHQAEDIKENEKDEFFLHVIESVLIDVATRIGKKDEFAALIVEAANHVRQNAFHIVIPIKKLSKISSNKKYKATTYREISPKGEIDYVEIKSGNEITTYILTEDYGFIPLENRVQKCMWKKNIFILMDNLGREFAVIDAEKEYMNCWLSPKNNTYKNKKNV